MKQRVIIINVKGPTKINGKRGFFRVRDELDGLVDRYGREAVIEMLYKMLNQRLKDNG